MTSFYGFLDTQHHIEQCYAQTIQTYTVTGRSHVQQCLILYAILKP